MDATAGTQAANDDDETAVEQFPAANLRAAFGYLDKQPKAIATDLKISRRQVSRLLRGPDFPSAQVQEAAGEYVIELGIPRWFIERGFAGANVPDETQLAERTQALENQMDTVLTIIGARAAAIAPEADPRQRSAANLKAAAQHSRRNQPDTTPAADDPAKTDLAS